ncbi:class I SAM-dependent methyltransferase [Rhodobacteraceae bacterium CCMM004]|nr:class I SAM-dependent methyltransferase [Rhodobacteraceae bacterium CCMM004]
MCPACNAPFAQVLGPPSDPGQGGRGRGRRTMTDHGAAGQALSAELEALTAELSAPAATIAAALGTAAPHDTARIAAAGREVTRIGHKVHDFSARLTRARAAAAATAAEDRTDGRAVLPPAWYQLGTRADGLRLALNRWPRIRAAVDEALPGRPRPLFPPRRRGVDPWAGRDAVGDALFGTLHQVLGAPAQDADAEAHGCFADIGLPHSLFMLNAHAAYRVWLALRRKGGADFLDVGCGGGLKVLSAAGFFARCTGLEYDPGYAAAAGDLLRRAGTGNCRILNGDALTYDNYDRYDVVYLYRPMRHEAALHALERRIVSQVRPGTILIAPYKGFAQRQGGEGCQPLGGALYVAGYTGAEARRLRRQAEFTGGAVVHSTRGVADVFTPVEAALHANGFDIADTVGALDA